MNINIPKDGVAKFTDRKGGASITVRKAGQTASRNHLSPCGSGRKFKKCCGR